MNRHIRQLYAVLLSFMLLFGGITVFADSDLPYESYTYINGAIKASPATVKVDKVITGKDLNCGDFKTPQDVFVFDNLIYIADTENNRIVVCDTNFKLVRTVESVILNGKESKLSSPKGIFVDGEYICIADMLNARVLILNRNFEVAEVLLRPEDDLFDKKREYKPQKVLRDTNGYFYVISSGTYEGAVLYNHDGSFNSFFGGNKTTVTIKLLAENMWRKFMNKTQLSKVEQVIPQEYGSFDIDKNNFIFTCTANTTEMSDQVKKLNPLGNNVWKTGVNYGDTVLEYASKSKIVSRLVDVAVGDNGIITAIDSERGHIFQYSAADGEIISVLGNIGVQNGTFGTLAAVAAYGDKLYVLDSSKSSLTVYSYTEYGITVGKALALHNDGRYDEAIELWKDVLKRNGNMQTAYCGIGKALMGKGEYKQAMQYFKLGTDKDGYSEAFSLLRKSVLKKHAVWLFPIVIVLIAAFLIQGVMLRKRKNTELKKYRDWQYPFHIMMHPSEGYKDLYWTRQDSVLTASVVFAVWLLSNILKRHTTAFLFNSNSTGKLNVNVWTYLIVLSALALSFVLINWAICTLFEGKGTLKRVFVYSAYSLVPVTIGNFIYIVFSYIFSLQEASFLELIATVFTLWTLALLLNGLSILHEYNLKQVILSVLSTVLGMAIVIFLVLLLVSLFNKVASFAVSLVNEFILHTQR